MESYTVQKFQHRRYSVCIFIVHRRWHNSKIVVGLGKVIALAKISLISFFLSWAAVVPIMFAVAL